MDKQTNELDRIIIGVREWAVDSVWTKGIGLDRWTAQGVVLPDTKIVLEEARKLEDFVLRKLPQFLSYLPVKEEII